MVRFEVLGVPQQKGSTRMLPVQGKMLITSANPKLKSWEHSVAWCARAAVTTPFAPPIAMTVEFRMPATIKSRRQATRSGSDVAHVSTPDLDKLIRGICDPMSGVVYEDDRQIAQVVALKRYCRPGEAPGAVIEVRSLAVVA